MASISLAGSVGGLDANSIVIPPASVDRPTGAQLLPEKADDTPQSAQLSSIGKLQSAMSTFLDAAQKLTEQNTWSATTAESSDPSAVSAVTERAASPGDYLVHVQQLAHVQATASTMFSGIGTVIGLGTLHIELGAWNSSQTAFATNPNWPKADVIVGPRDNSLERIRDKINAAGVGVVAIVMSDATGSRLVLRSTSSGLDNGFKVSASEAPPKESLQAGLAALGFDPAAVSAPQMELTQSAADAKATVNGVKVQSPSNTLTQAVDGLVLQLNQVTDEPVTVSVKPDKSAIKKAVNDFVTAYNDLNTVANHQTGIDSTGLSRAAQSHMRNIVGQHSQAAPLSKWLSDMGVSMEASGALKVDNQKLDDSISNRLHQTQKLFSKPPSGIKLSLVATEPAEPSYKSKLAAQYAAIHQDLRVTQAPIDHIVENLSKLDNSG